MITTTPIESMYSTHVVTISSNLVVSSSTTFCLSSPVESCNLIDLLTLKHRAYTTKQPHPP